jgi:hypothetical protein
LSVRFIIEYYYRVSMISGFCLRGGKHVAANFKRGQKQINAGGRQPTIKYTCRESQFPRGANQGAEAPSEINPATIP